MGGSDGTCLPHFFPSIISLFQPSYSLSRSQLTFKLSHSHGRRVELGKLISKFHGPVKTGGAVAVGCSALLGQKIVITQKSSVKTLRRKIQRCRSCPPPTIRREPGAAPKCLPTNSLKIRTAKISRHPNQLKRNPKLSRPNYLITLTFVKLF